METNEQCETCECFYINWDDDVQETMDENAPGEACSLSGDTFAVVCPHYQPTE